MSLNSESIGQDDSNAPSSGRSTASHTISTERSGKIIIHPLSRTKVPLYEKSIPNRFFNQIKSSWGLLKIDTFANQHNHQLKKYWSLMSDPGATAVDAFEKKIAKEGLILLPSMEVDLEITPSHQDKSITPSDLGKVVVDNTVLVFNAITGATTNGSNDISTESFNDFSRLVLIRKARSPG